MKLRGRVEVREDFSRFVPSPRYGVEWQRRPNAEDAQIVEAGFANLDDAIAWARARAQRVFVDLEDEPVQHLRYFIGDRRSYGEPWPGELPPEPEPTQDHGGDAYIRDEAHWVPEGFLAVHWEDERELEREHHAHDLEAAIDWGRSRASVVLVDLLPESYSSPSPPKPTRYSAGIEDPSGKALPRLRPRPGEVNLGWRATFGEGVEYTVDAASRDDARQKATELYIQEVLKLEDGTFFVVGPDVRPLDESGSQAP